MVEVIFPSGGWVCLPIDEFDGAFETGVAAAHPFVFRNAEEVEEYRLQVRYSCLAHANPGDGGSLDNRDIKTGQCFLEIRGGHPAGSATADDNDLFDEVRLVTVLWLGGSSCV